MSDDLRRRRPEDPNYINRHQEWELDYWSKELGVSKAQLISAIDAVGNRVADVKRHLKK